LANEVSLEKFGKTEKMFLEGVFLLGFIEFELFLGFLYFVKKNNAWKERLVKNI
jgi:hypothetical protein